MNRKRSSLPAKRQHRVFEPAGRFTNGNGDSEPRKLKNKRYRKELKRPQIELVKLQEWIKQEGLKVVVRFEGRDAAGKGGTIKRITQRMNPRICRVVALGTPTEKEKSQWYFQRYAAHLPAAGEMVLFDRSWYNRAGVERMLIRSGRFRVRLHAFVLMAGVAAMRDSSAVVLAVKRYEKRLRRNKVELEQLKRACQLSNVEICPEWQLVKASIICGIQDQTRCWHSIDFGGEFPGICGDGSLIEDTVWGGV